ncbi:glycosyltransferase [Sulfidibacter corallicola]|uniref:Glycosyltransferase n=1 Tax=Sulfidibacter corallicola TaxID=2818388 RepID=A0A8A4TQM1_SULCO|nr:glycosyltransferase [Sulfidibacter corallicola]QTD51298.1 glycosyltransferase [Sulfidibacter corallicola]
MPEQRNPTSQKVEALSLVVAVFNDRDLLPQSGLKLAEALAESNLDWELIFVDDFSKDSSFDLLQSIRTRWPDRIKTLRLARNYGQHVALYAGMSHAEKPWILTFDLDYAPAIHALDDILDQVPLRQADLVNVSRLGQRKQSMVRSFGSWFFGSLANRVTGKPMADPLSSIKLVARSIFQQGRLYGEQRQFLAPLALKLADQPVELSVELPPKRGRSSFGSEQLVRLALDFVLAFFPMLFTRLLIWSIALGLSSVAAGGLYLVLRLFGWIDPSTHFQVICLTLTALSIHGVLMALIGEYQVRIHRLLYQQEFFRLEEDP